MAILPIGNNPLAQLFNLNARNAITKFGLLAITIVAIDTLSNLPKANALGGYFKDVNRACYDKCKHVHGFWGQACFWGCCSSNHLKNKHF